MDTSITEITAAIQSQQFERALQQLQAFASTAQTFSDAEFIQSALADIPSYPQAYRVVKIGVLRSFTIEPWLSVLSAALFKHHCIATFFLGDFDSFEEYIEANPALKTFAPDIILLAFESKSILRDQALRAPWDEENRITAFADLFLARMQRLLQALSQQFSGQVILFNFAPPWPDYYAPASHQSPQALGNSLRKINIALAGYAETYPRVTLFDLDYQAARFGLERAMDRNMWYFAANPFSIGFILAAGQVLAWLMATFYHPPKKCVVVDLDNTLWGGILGEDGPGRLKIGATFPGIAYREFQLYLKGLQKKGILLAINSKNNESDCLEFFRTAPGMVLRLNDFAAVKINWASKAENLKSIAGELNLGLDSFVFIDDSPFECELVKSLLPEVTVIPMPLDPSKISACMLALSELQGLRVLVEDKNRHAYYVAEKQRQTFQRDCASLDEYLHNLQMEVFIQRADDSAIARIAQLTQKTNQFNLTSRRYQESDITNLLADQAQIYTLRLQDLFGDYGLTGVAIIRETSPGEWLIDTLLLSCRILGRSVEVAFVASILAEIKKLGGQTVLGEYIPSAKNDQVKEFYPKLQFTPIASSLNGAIYRFDVQKNPLPEIAHFLKVTCEGSHYE